MSPSTRRLAPLIAAGAVLVVVVAVLGVARLVGGSGDGDGRTTPPATAPAAPSTEPGPDDPMSRFTATRAGADGRSVDVTFYGGVDTCFRYAIRAEETAREVALSLSEERRSDRPCIDLAQEYRRSVPLDAPLDERRVVDAATGDVLLEPAAE